MACTSKKATMSRSRANRCSSRRSATISSIVVAAFSSSSLPDPALSFVPPSQAPSHRAAYAHPLVFAPPLQSIGTTRLPRSHRGRPLFSDKDNDDSSDEKGEMIPEDIDPHEYFADRADFTIDADDSNTWVGVDDNYEKFSKEEDWEETMAKRQDGTAWASSEVTGEDGDSDGDGEEKGEADLSAKAEDAVLDGGEEAWLGTLASISAEEVEFNMQEADRADKVRQMQEWGFDSGAIAETLGVATDETLEKFEDNEVFESFKEITKESGFGMYVDDDVDLSAVESHTTVERDDETGDLIRTQMVYVDEVTCIGCTNCAMIAQSTFFMDSEHGRARVFQQWGDDDETIQVAIETCPVDCIHYVPYDELEKLEVERRDQNINFKARLVNQGEYGGDSGHRIGGSTVFTGPQTISGNMGARCNNCPSRGCKNCPMFGVGDNPEFKKNEEARKARKAKKLLQEKLESENKSAEL